MFLNLKVGNLVEPLTGRQWNQQSIMAQLFQRLSFYESQGMKHFDRVFIHHSNKLEFFVDLLAVWYLGGCAIPIDSRLTKFEVETLAQTARPRFSLWHGNLDEPIAKGLSLLDIKILETTDAFKDNYREPPSPQLKNKFSLDQAALILFTSGTTGNPKGVVHTHRSLRARWMALFRSLGLSRYRRTLCLLPTHFGHGLICNCLFPWLFGQDLFIVPPFKPDLVIRLGALLDEFDITFMSSVPSVWRLALKMAKPPQIGTLERVFCGSAPLSKFLWQGIQEWAGTKEVFNAYGITETGSWVAGTTILNFEPEDGLIGEPWGAVVKILKNDTTDRLADLMQECPQGEVGHIWLNTPALMQGYFERDDLTNEVVNQGWFMTGDVGLVDYRGYLFLRGRKREEINKGGMKVYPADIDTVVEQFPGVVDVCCFSYEEDDSLYGENVGVAVVLTKKKNETMPELYHWTKLHLAKYQMPAKWYLIDEIPRTSRGKLNRANVAEKCVTLKPVDVGKTLHKNDG